MQEARGPGYKRTTGCSDGIALCLDCLNVSILFVISYYSFARCYPWEKLGKGYKGSLCTVSYNCTGMYNYLKIKSLIIKIKQKPHPFIISQIRSPSIAQLDLLLRSHQAEPKVPARAWGSHLMLGGLLPSSIRSWQNSVPCGSRTALPFPG